MDRPMMSEKEIDIIDYLFEKNRFKQCLEWGSGGSTVYFPRKHTCIERWVSIEHNGRYLNMIKNGIEKMVDLRHVTLDMYLSTVKEERFDFILIDGLMRAECLMFGRDLLLPGGMILMHDSGRSEYQKVVKEWEGTAVKLSDGELEVTGCAHRGLHKFVR